MEFYQLINGTLNILQPFPLALLVLGTFVGIVFGSIPGMTAAMGIVLFLPLTFKIDPVSSISLLLGIYTGGISGGLISAALLRMPGTPSSVATCFDAYPMANKGEPGKALGIGIIASFLSGLITCTLMVVLSPIIAKIALKFGNFEYFTIGLLALSIVVLLSKKSMVKGLLSAALGLLCATTGGAPLDMIPRFTFGLDDLLAGFNQLPFLIGLFAISQIMSEMGASNDVLVPRVPVTGVVVKIKDFFKGDFRTFVESSLIGFFIGILPGIGGATANIVAYGNAKAHSKHPELFGTGYKSGIIASESANNATIAGALIPMLTMGIPGDAVTAVLIGALMIQGLQPGPLLFAAHGEFVYSAFAACFIGNIVMFVMMLFAIKVFIKALSIPKIYLLPLIMVMCIVGAYALNNRIFDMWVLLGFGIVGYLLEKQDYPLTPMVLGFVLGPLIETNIREGIMSSSGSWMPLINRPIPCVCLILTLISISWPLKEKIFARRH
ncbi:MAG: tripartite tricarboxylate transporter permease [Synergistaceae bacterium]|nr:tripartite tricarboxylate transporter permease [Synergistaceae bacterium]